MTAPHDGQYTASPGTAAPQLRAPLRSTAPRPRRYRPTSQTDDRHAPPTLTAGGRFRVVAHRRGLAAAAVDVASSCSWDRRARASRRGRPQQFRADQVVSTDALRALVGEGEHDQRAGTDAFAVLDDVLERRLRRRLLTVIDSLGLEAARRRAWLAVARRHGVPCHVVAFPTPAAVCRARNRERQPPLPSKVITSQRARLRRRRSPRWPTRASTACTRRPTS